jgi:hypothetical protein
VSSSTPIHDRDQRHLIAASSASLSSWLRRPRGPTPGWCRPPEPAREIVSAEIGDDRGVDWGMSMTG